MPQDDTAALTREDLHLKRLTIRIQLLLGVIGACLTLVLGYGQYQIQRGQHVLATQQQRLQQDLEEQRNLMQTLTIAKEYLPLMDDPSQGKKARAIISRSATYFSSKYHNTFLAELAAELLESANVPRNDKDVLQITEATAPAPLNEGWFTVVASFDVEQLDYARRKRDEIARQQNQYPVEVYKTKISRYFAVTIGGRKTKLEAQALVRTARVNGWARDAFAQLDREWSRVE
jgi:hypothetical protein